MNTVRSGIKHVFASFLMALMLAGCATSYPPAPKNVGDSHAHNYIIGPGDNISIIVWHSPDISMALPVRPDGKISTPLVEDLIAAGKTPTQLARDLEKALSKYIQDPIVTVVVTGFSGPYDQQIRVIGQAAKPQALQYRDNMTLMDVMIVVGGITEFAAGNRATILRKAGGVEKQFSVRLDDLIKDGDISANVPMRPGDVLIIPESYF